MEEKLLPDRELRSRLVCQPFRVRLSGRGCYTGLAKQCVRRHQLLSTMGKIQKKQNKTKNKKGKT